MEDSCSWPNFCVNSDSDILTWYRPFYFSPNKSEVTCKLTKHFNTLTQNTYMKECIMIDRLNYLRELQIVALEGYKSVTRKLIECHFQKEKARLKISMSDSVSARKWFCKQCIFQTISIMKRSGQLFAARSF